jgi:hypothetical protein
MQGGSVKGDGRVKHATAWNAVFRQEANRRRIRRIIMKKKNVLRLLAFVMAASLTVTSAPAGLLSGTETVYADANASLDSNNLIVTADSITVKAAFATTGVQFLLVAKDQNITDVDGSGNWITGLGADTRLSLTANNNQVVAATQTLYANTTYRIYWRYVGGKASNYFDVTTNKISLKDAVIELKDDNSQTTNNTGSYDTSTYSKEFKGAAWEPEIDTVTLADGTQLAAGALANLNVSYRNNVNAGSITDDDESAPTVVVTGTGDYEGTAYVKFTITPYDLTAHADKVRVTIGGVVNNGTNKYTVEYNGLQQNPSIVVEAQLDPNSTEYTKLTKGTDFVVNADLSSNSNTNDNKAAAMTGAETIAENKINYNIDAGTVTVVLEGTGNYQNSKSDSFEIKKANPTAPSAPTITDIGANSFVINTQDEDLKYAYQNMILDAETTNYVWPAANATTAIVSPVGDKNTYTKANITVSNTAGAQTLTANNGANLTTTATFMSGNASNLLAGHTYYVVRRIISDSNVTESSTSVVAKVTMAPTDINSVVAVAPATVATFKDKQKNTALTLTDTVFTALNKTYDGKAQDDIEVTLYDKTANHNVMTGYTVKYYNSHNPNQATGMWGTENDITNAGVVSVYAVGDGVNYSGAILLGTYTISKKSVTAIVGDGTKVYDSTTDITGALSADVKDGLVSGDSVHVEGLDGVTKYAAAGTQDLTAVTTGWATKITGTGCDNYDIRYNYASSKVTITKATVSIGGDANVTAYFGKAIDLRAAGYVTSVASLNDNLTYTLNDSDGSLTGKLTLDSTTGVLRLLDYDSLKNQVGITITVRYGNGANVANDNYALSDAAGKTINVTLAKAPTVLVYADAKVQYDTETENGKAHGTWANNASWVLENSVVRFPSYTRPSAIREVVENQAGVWSNQAGIWTTAGVIDPAYNSGQTTVATPTEDDATVVYKYYTESGVELDTIPYNDGTYYVKAYVYPSTDVAEKHIDGSQVAGTLKLIIGNGKSTSSDSANNATTDTVNDESRSDGYKVVDGKVYTIKDDSLIRSEFVTITATGATVYANKNGVMVHGKSFKAADGYWHYANEDGSVITAAGVQNTDNGNKVYCYGDNNGRLLVSGSKKAEDGNKYVANTKGILVKNGFTTTKKGYKYYVENYVVAQNKKFTYTKNNKTYIATKTGTIAQGAKVVTFNGKKYYVYAKGSVAKSTTVKYKGKTYVANKSGVLTLKK